MKILHTADWHIGPMKGPEKDGINLRELDTNQCIEHFVQFAKTQNSDVIIIAGDLFHQAEVWQGRSHKESLFVRKQLLELKNYTKHIVVLRGTPNHDSKDIFLQLQAQFEFDPQIAIILEPVVLTYPECNVIAIPGYDKSLFSSLKPGMTKEEECIQASQELNSLIVNLKIKGDPTKPSILTTHYATQNCILQDGTTQAAFTMEPIIQTNALQMANYDLTCLGHIHVAQSIPNVPSTFYSGNINALSFNDENSKKGFFMHDLTNMGCTTSFIETPYRPFLTLYWDETTVNTIHNEKEGLERVLQASNVAGKIVRIQIKDSVLKELKPTINQINKELYKQHAFFSQGFYKFQNETVAKFELSKFDHPLENLKHYLSEKVSPEQTVILCEKAEPIISTVLANENKAQHFGRFTPIEISVQNYRSYKAETFSFDPISFCLINGSNGTGKSSLFMDAILDCLYEQPRDQNLTGWITNEPTAKSGKINFTFAIGDQIYRIFRSRLKSGKGTLTFEQKNDDNTWMDLSEPKTAETQTKIEQLLGMDSMTMKSCMLIMQDQYGVFLENSKNDRIKILATLLGLDIYEEMSKLSKEKAAEFRKQESLINDRIDMLQNELSSIGNPEEIKHSLEELLQSLKQQKEQIQKQKDAVVFAQSQYTALNEQLQKENLTLTDLLNRKVTNNTDLLIVKNELEQCEKTLSNKEQLQIQAIQYQTSESELKRLAYCTLSYITDKRNQATSLRNNELEQVTSLNNTKAEIDRLNALKNQCSLIAQSKEELSNQVHQDQLQIQNGMNEQNQIADLKQQISNLEQQQLQALSQIDLEFQAMQTKKQNLENQTEILKSSGCINESIATCNFLAEAKKAEKELQAYENLDVQINQKKEQTYQYYAQMLQPLKTELQSKSMQKDDLISAQNQLALHTKQLNEVIQSESLAQQLDQANRMYNDVQNNLHQTQDLLYRLNQELMQIESDFASVEQHTTTCRNTQPAFEQFQQLPVLEERKKQLEFKQKDLNNLQTQILADCDKQEQEIAAIHIKLQSCNFDPQVLQNLEQQIQTLEHNETHTQQELTLINQKFQRIQEIQNAIKENNQCLTNVKTETNDYEFLQLAFSQNGIPHQIIKSLSNQLSDRASEILSKMTNGTMSLKFITEAPMKSDSKKEVLTLDIIIQEQNKPDLPYLSKSGGEKVKAALAVILALAEVKSATSGIQMGMLFIDEPPFLDDEGTQAYCDALEIIQYRYPGIKIMAITHDPTMKSRFPQCVDIIKNEEGSHAIFQG